MFVQQGRSQVKNRGVTFLPARPRLSRQALSHEGTLRV